MQLFSAFVTALVTVGCTVPIVSGAALPSDGTAVEARSNPTLVDRAQSDEIIYIANCQNSGGAADTRRGSFAPWYSDWRNSQNGQAPQSLTNEYHDNGDTVTFEGRQPVFTYPNGGPILYIHIQSNGLDVGFQSYAGYLDRNFNGVWTRFNCYRDSDRQLFSANVDGGNLVCYDTLYYCAPI